MKATDLRINNFVQTSNNEVIQITDILANNMVGGTSKDGVNKFYSLEDIKPIKLTDEFFGATDWEYEEETEMMKPYYYGSNGKFNFMAFINKDLDYYTLAIGNHEDETITYELRYVHELQNIIRDMA